MSRHGHRPNRRNPVCTASRRFLRVLQVADLIQPVQHHERVAFVHQAEAILAGQVLPDRAGQEGVEQPVPGDLAGDMEVPEDERDRDAVAEPSFPRVGVRHRQLPGEPIDQRGLAAAGVAENHQAVVLRDGLPERLAVTPALGVAFWSDGLPAQLRLNEQPVNPHVLVILQRRQAKEPDRPVGGPDGGQVVPYLLPLILPRLPAGESREDIDRCRVGREPLDAVVQTNILSPLFELRVFRAVIIRVRPSGHPVIEQEREDIDPTVDGVMVLHLGDTALLPGGDEPSAEPDQQHTGLTAVEPVQAKPRRLVRVRGPILHRIDVVARLAQLRDHPLPVLFQIDVGGGDEHLDWPWRPPDSWWNVQWYGLTCSA